MPPVIIAAGVAAAGAVASSAMSSSAAKKNAKTAANSTTQQINAATANRDYQYALNAPSIGYGNAADSRIAGLLNIGGDPAASAAAFNDYRASTGYDTRLTEALQSVNQRAFGGGMGQSGAALKALQDRGSDVAGQYFNTYVGQLGGVSAGGANSRGLVAGVGNNSTNQLINASQIGAQQQISANNASATSQTELIQNLINAGGFAYGSSYGGGKPGAPSGGRNAPWYVGGQYGGFGG